MLVFPAPAKRGFRPVYVTTFAEFANNDRLQNSNGWYPPPSSTSAAWITMYDTGAPYGMQARGNTATNVRAERNDLPSADRARTYAKAIFTSPAGDAPFGVTFHGAAAGGQILVVYIRRAPALTLYVSRIYGTGNTRQIADTGSASLESLGFPRALAPPYEVECRGESQTQFGVYFNGTRIGFRSNTTAHSTENAAGLYMPESADTRCARFEYGLHDL